MQEYGCAALTEGNCYQSFSRTGFERYPPNGMSQRMKGMNAVMRRLDLFCKLAAPLFVSLLTIKSSSFSAIFLAASNIVSLPFEYFFIQFVYCRFPDLAVKHPQATPSEPLLTEFFRVPRRTMSSWKTYYRSPLFLASFALCTLYFTVLSFGGYPIAAIRIALIVRLDDRLPISILQFLDPAHRWTSCCCSCYRDGGYIRRPSSNSLNRAHPRRPMVLIMANNTPHPSCSLTLHPRESRHARRSPRRIRLHKSPRPLELRSLRTTPRSRSPPPRAPARPRPHPYLLYHL